MPEPRGAEPGDDAAPIEVAQSLGVAVPVSGHDRFQRQLKQTLAQLDATRDLIVRRTGRNLVLAILIGLAGGAVIMFSLIVIKDLFQIFMAIVVGFGIAELSQALRGYGRRIPLVPAVLSGVALLPLAFYFGPAAHWLGLVVGILVVAVWRVAEQGSARLRTGARALVSDIAAAAFVLTYIPFLAGFAVLLTAQPGGEWWVFAFIIVVVSVDTGAYAVGLAWGRHPMAPRISPKKTWEGFGGAIVAGLTAGVLLAVFMLQEPWWVGLPFGAVLIASATIGDLAESLIKRDLGVKDMSSWLPGHGGFLDRLDSMLPSCAAAYALFLAFS